MVVPGIDLASSRASLELADAHPGRLRPTAGLHPHDAAAWPEQSGGIVDLMPHVAAVGETGLDFYRDLSPRDVQIDSFRDHIELAEGHELPLIVHCRDAFADTYELLADADLGQRAVLHCWTGGTRWTKRFGELGVTFSFAGPVAFETGETIRLGAEHADPERCLVETDTPYLSPPPFRGDQNEPARVALVGAALAEVWGLPVEEVAAMTSRQAAAVFGAPA